MQMPFEQGPPPRRESIMQCFSAWSNMGPRCFINRSVYQTFSKSGATRAGIGANNPHMHEACTGLMESWNPSRCGSHTSIGRSGPRHRLNNIVWARQRTTSSTWLESTSWQAHTANMSELMLHLNGAGKHTRGQNMADPSTTNELI